MATARRQPSNIFRYGSSECHVFSNWTTAELQPTCKLSRSRSTPRSRWRKSAWLQARPQPTPGMQIAVLPPTSPSYVVLKAVSSCPRKAELNRAELNRNKQNRTSNTGQPPWFVSVVLLPAPMISKISLHYIALQDRRKRSENILKAWIHLSRNHPQPVPLDTATFFMIQGETLQKLLADRNGPASVAWILWSFVSGQGSQQTAAHWLCCASYLLPFS